MFSTQVSTSELDIVQQARPGRSRKWLLCVTTFLCILELHNVSCSSEKTGQQAEELTACINEGQGFARTSWNSSILDDSLPNIKVEKLWWSQRPPKFPVTILTQLSVDRMPALFNQCTTYLGPMSAAVYLPLLQPDEDGTSELSSENKKKLGSETARIGRIYDSIEAAGGCQLDLMLVYEVFDSSDASLLYPVNTLRNLARMQVRTKLLSAIDVDMMISRTLSDELADPGKVSLLERQALSKVATVLPAFEPNRQGPVGRAMADHIAMASKEEMQKMFKAKEALQFKLKVFPRGHTPTNYTWWFQTSQPYPVTYKRMFEPWFITHWDVMPWFDVNFKGYGLNKIVHVASLNYYGFTFQVNPGAWLVHRPHEDTRVRKLVARQASDVNKLGVKLPKNALYHKVTILFGAAKRAMIKGQFSPRLDDRMVACFDKLPWLQPLKQLTGAPVDPSIFI